MVLNDCPEQMVSINFLSFPSSLNSACYVTSFNGAIKDWLQKNEKHQWFAIFLSRRKKEKSLICIWKVWTWKEEKK